MSAPPELIEGALLLAERGYYVFPAVVTIDSDRKKHFRSYPDWDANSTRDPERIRAMFAEDHASAASWTSVCIDTGKSGITVLDCDVSDRKNGVREYARLRIPDGAMASTPSGGVHNYFANGGVGPVKNGTDTVAVGIDTRSTGGLVIAPPSTDARGGYSWEGSALPPARDSLPELPEMVIGLMEERGRAKATPKAATPHEGDPFGQPKRPYTLAQAEQLVRVHAEILRNAAPQTVNDTLNTQALIIYGFVPVFFDKETVDEGLLAAQKEAWVRNGGDPNDTDDSAARATMASAWGASRRNPAVKVEDDDPFVEALAEYRAEELREATETLDWEQSVEAEARKLRVRRAAAKRVEVEEAAHPYTEDELDAYMEKAIPSSKLKDLPPPEWLIEGWILKNSICRVIGAGGSFKSFLLLGMADFVARGRHWHGRQVSQGRVLYVMAEASETAGQRLAALHEAWGLEDTDDLVIWPTAVQIGGPEWAKFVGMCERMGVALVVFDTQAKCTVGLEENSATDTGRWISALDQLKYRTGATIAVLHHTGHGATTQDRARGSSAGYAGVDTEILVKGGDDLICRVRVIRQKDGPVHTEDTAFEMRPYADSITPVLITAVEADKVEKERQETRRLEGIVNAQTMNRRELLAVVLSEHTSLDVPLTKTDIRGLYNEALRAREKKTIKNLDRSAFVKAWKRAIETDGWLDEAKGKYWATEAANKVAAEVLNRVYVPPAVGGEIAHDPTLAWGPE